MRAVNLLPPDLRGASKRTAELGARPEATGGAGPFVVLGVLAACVAGTAGYVLTNNTIEQRQADLAAVNAREQALAAKTAQLKPFADFEAMANSRVQTVRDLAGSRFDWEQSLRDLARAIPADVTLTSLAGDINSSVNGGASSSQLRGDIQSPAITLKGCAPGQTQVAQLMARLRAVDGVTRVSLSKSDVQKVDTTTDTTGTATQRRDAAPCGVGERPTFEVVMFFEGAAAAETAPSTASSATAAPTPTPAPGATATPTPTTSAADSTTASTTPNGGATP